LSGLRQRNPSYRNRKLLDLAHEAPCMLQLGEAGCGNNLSSACHSDLLEHGRGVGLKSHDWAAVPGCPACHARFTREHLGLVEYKAVWQKAHDRYQDWLWRNNKIKVV